MMYLVCVNRVSSSLVQSQSLLFKFRRLHKQNPVIFLWCMEHQSLIAPRVITLLALSFLSTGLLYLVGTLFPIIKKHQLNTFICFHLFFENIIQYILIIDFPMPQLLPEPSSSPYPHNFMFFLSIKSKKKSNKQKLYIQFVLTK